MKQGEIAGMGFVIAFVAAKVLRLICCRPGRGLVVQ
jgi:hypothetical protein